VSDSLETHWLFRAEWEGKTIRVLDPISLLACKLELAAKVCPGKAEGCYALKNPTALCSLRFWMNFSCNKLNTARLPAKDWLKIGKPGA
jgi:hypothetical protein